MVRQLAALLGIGTLLLGASGGCVLLLAMHECLYHPDAHRAGAERLDAALQIAVHGHAHEGTPDHNHELTAPLATSRAAIATALNGAGPEGRIILQAPQNEAPGPLVPALASCGLGPPSYLLHCVLLT